MPSSRFFTRVAALCHAGRVVAVIAHGRNVGDVDHRHLPALLLQDVDPLVPVLGHRRGIARPVVADIFIHGRERAQIAIRALRDVDDHVPFLHGDTPPLNVRALVHRDHRYAVISPAPATPPSACSRTSLSFSMRAKVSDMCSVRPSHSSTCTSELAPAIECVDLGLRALGREQVEAPSPIDRFAGLAHRIVDRRGLVAVAHAARQPLRRQRRADHRAAIVEDLHQVVLLDAALGGVLGVEPHDPVVVAADLDPMVLDVEQERILAVALGVEASTSNAA